MQASANHTVVTVDAKKRIRLPFAKPGQYFSVEKRADGGWTLTLIVPTEEKAAKVRLVKKGGYTVAVSDRPWDEAAVKAALEEFP